MQKFYLDQKLLTILVFFFFSNEIADCCSIRLATLLQKDCRYLLEFGFYQWYLKNYHYLKVIDFLVNYTKLYTVRLSKHKFNKSNLKLKGVQIILDLTWMTVLAWPSMVVAFKSALYFPAISSATLRKSLSRSSRGTFSHSFLASNEVVMALLTSSGVA